MMSNERRDFVLIKALRSTPRMEQSVSSTTPSRVEEDREVASCSVHDPSGMTFMLVTDYILSDQG